MSALERLQNWFLSTCDGDREHMYGIRISTIDNPGWRVEINVAETVLDGCQFSRVEITDADSQPEWLHAWLENGVWNAACGPMMLTRAIEMFLEWADAGGSK